MVSSGTFLAGDNPLTDPIALFLIQALIIICISRVLAIGLGHLRQPRVIAEVIGGILLGPSVLSRSTAFRTTIFPAESLPRLSLVANIGLIFFLFLVGLELDPTTLVKRARQSAAISITGIALPFAAGVGVSKLIYDNLADQTVPFYSFFVFCGVAMSITAFPVLARILTELKLLASPVGQVTLAAAAVDDGTAWCLLILVVALINNPSDSVRAVYVFLTVLAWGLFLYFAVRPVLVRLVHRNAGSDGISSASMLAIFVVILGSSWFTQAVGVHAIFGGFLAGLICPHDHGFAIKLTEKIEDFVTILLLPLYFAYSGLNTDIGSLSDGSAWGYVMLVIVVACGGKVIGCTLAAKVGGFNWRESLAVGFLMNSKGLVELIVLNLGYTAGVINQKIFTIFVCMALVTTFITTPICSLIYPPRFYMKYNRRNGGAGGDTQHDHISTIGGGDIEKGADAADHKVFGGDAAQHMNVMLVLTGMSSVPPLMALTQMFQSSPSSLSIFGLRLIKLTQRASTYLMAANEGETLRADPVINVFRTFGQLNRVGVHTLVNVVPSEDFPENIREASSESSAHLLVLPWQQPPTSKESCLNDRFVRETVENAPCSIAVFVDRGFGVASTDLMIPGAAVPGQNQHVFVPIFGTADDCEALRFVSNIAAHPGLSVTIFDLRPAVATAAAAAAATPELDSAGGSHATLKIINTDSATTAASNDQFSSLLRLLTTTSANITVQDASAQSADAANAISLRAASSFGRKDLVVLSYNAYTTNTDLRRWADEECESSCAIVKKHAARSLSDEHVPGSPKAHPHYVDSQLDRRRDLERKLRKDTEDLELLEESLAKTNVLTNKIESMLSSFDYRLGRLETSILPIHRSTQKLTKLYDHIDGSLAQVQTVIDYFDIGTKEEAFLARGPQEPDLAPFLKSVESLKEALIYLQRTKYKASERATNTLKYTLTKALGQLNNLFRKWLTAASVPLDTLNRDVTADIPFIPADQFTNLSTLSLELQTSSVGDLSFPPVYLKVYEEVRSAYLLKSLAPLAAAAKEQEQKGLQGKAAYAKGSSALVGYTKWLLKLLKAERGLTGKLLPKANGLTSFQATITPAVDAFVQLGESMCARVKKNVSKREYGDVFMLIDVVEGLVDGIREYDGIIAFAGAKGNEINDLAANCKAVVIQVFAQFYDYIKNDTGKGAAISVDGTVHELTSTTLNTLRRLVEYNDVIDRIIADGANPMGASTFATTATDILTSLSISLDAKAKTYKKPTLGAIFLLNNFSYILKHVRSSGLADVVGALEISRLEKSALKGRQGYRDSWTPVIEAVSDKGTTAFSPGTAKPTLTNSQRTSIKDQFKTFNTEFEETTRAQRAYSVPDPDLRATLVKDIKAIICPFYKQFYEKHIELDFTKNQEKYVKYTPKTLEAAIEHFFEPDA
ncbi:K(+)/H(+) antiporter [Geranomyces variabilis]|nr:K(+)/H(+) antiporter [Geranomyces variabilis]